MSLWNTNAPETPIFWETWPWYSALNFAEDLDLGTRRCVSMRCAFTPNMSLVTKQTDGRTTVKQYAPNLSIRGHKKTSLPSSGMKERYPSIANGHLYPIFLSGWPWLWPLTTDVVKSEQNVVPFMQYCWEWNLHLSQGKTWPLHLFSIQNGWLSTEFHLCNCSKYTCTSFP